MFPGSHFQSHPDSVILQKFQSLSNDSFKHNSADVSSLYLTPTLPFESRFLCLLLTVTTQKQTRVVLGLLVAFLSLHTIPYLQRTGKGGYSSRVTFSIFPGVKTQELSRALKVVESAKERFDFNCC